MPSPRAPKPTLRPRRLIFGDDVTSFGDLSALAQRCAASLAARGIGRGDVVALQLPKRRLTYGLLLACLRLGAPYVFLDPKNPPERSARIIERDAAGDPLHRGRYAQPARTGAAPDQALTA